MANSYNVTDVITVAAPATMTDILSTINSRMDGLNPIRRPQTVLNISLSCFIISVMAMFIFSVALTQAQTWVPAPTPLPQKVIYNGLVGIGPFAPPPAIPTLMPQTMLHVHSTNVADVGHYPAILRLQTQVQAIGEANINNFGQTGIEFFSGSILNGGLDWCAGKILGISNGHGLANSDQFVTPGTAEFKGGLAFFCSPLTNGTQPNATTDQIEVMRIVEDKVGIRTKYPLGQLDVNVGDANAKPKASITNGTTPHLDDTYGGPQLRFYIPYDNVDSPPDRSSSYSWYIHTMRQKDPACFLGLDGTQGPTWYNTTLSAMHFMAGYNTASHAAGDIYRDNKGSETAIPRMSLLSNGNVGINNSVPMARLQVTEGSVLFEGTFEGNQGLTPYKRVVDATTPILVAHREELDTGTRLMWIPSKAAFRVGHIDGAGWNSYNIGDYSIAMGKNSIATGQFDIALGVSNQSTSNLTAGAHGAISIGHGNKSKGLDAVAIGFENFAYGDNSIAMGFQSQATAIHSIAIGEENLATNKHSIAFGHLNKAYAEWAVTLGKDCRVNIPTTSDGSNNGSFAIGNTATSYANGCFTIGNAVANSVDNSLLIGFDNSTLPGLFVKRDGPSTNRVAIGGINPTNKLDVNGSVTIGDGSSPTYLGSSGNHSLAVKHNASIGTMATPSCTLGVDGTACIGWSGTGAVPTTGINVGMIIQHAVIIGGTTPTYVTAGARLSDPDMLQVTGDVLKFETTATSNWDIPSDARYKKDVHPFDDGLQLLRQINPVRFKYNEKLGIRGSDDEEGIGVLAQDMQKIAPYTVHDNILVKSIQSKQEKRYQVDDFDTVAIRIVDYSQTDTTIGSDGHRHSPDIYKDSTIYKPIKRWVIEPAEFRSDSLPLLTYNSSALTYVIINSVKEIDSLRSADKQELIEQINRQNNVIHSQNSTIDSLILANKNFEERIARLETKNEISLDEVSDVILEQNNPNPFSENTTITYYIPDKVQGDAELVIAPAASQSPALQKYPLTKGTPTQLIISAQDLYTGVFVYSITVNGKVIVSKKFIVIK